MPQISRSVWIPLSIYRTCQLVLIRDQILCQLPSSWWCYLCGWNGELKSCPWTFARNLAACQLNFLWICKLRTMIYSIFMNFIHSAFPFTCKCSMPQLLRTHLSSSLSLLWCLNALFLLLYSNCPSYYLHVFLQRSCPCLASPISQCIELMPKSGLALTFTFTSYLFRLGWTVFQSSSSCSRSYFWSQQLDALSLASIATNASRLDCLWDVLGISLAVLRRERERDRERERESPSKSFMFLRNCGRVWQNTSHETHWMISLTCKWYWYWQVPRGSKSS